MPLAGPHDLEIALRLVVALGLGATVGVERTYRGRPAGFRTHALVSLSTCMLMLVTVYAAELFPQHGEARLTLDPTRMAQGVMTGIGFLGAGAILREGFSVKGLTTAASIWVTAAIGILVGIGFTFPAVLGAVLTLATLAGFRGLEDRISTPFHARVVARFGPGDPPTRGEIERRMGEAGFQVSSIAYRISPKRAFEVRMLVRSRTAIGADALVERLVAIPQIEEVRVSPADD